MNTNKQVTWVVEGKIKTGQALAFKEIMTDMVALTKKEQGTLMYDWMVAEDGETVHVYERYQDESAAIAHLDTWGKHAARFTSAVDMNRVVVYSELSPELRAAFAGPNTVFMKPVGGLML